MTATAVESLTRVVAASPAMKEVLKVASRLASVTSPVLVEGESGTGKDLLAHFIHYRGPRRDGPFLKIHCPSIPEDLLESELFGHEKGAFTDARHAKAGKIELADGGTLYFDQVHDLQPSLQAKLLRVVEERRFERLGGTRTIEVDVRFISSASQDLRQAVAAGTFRDDLYHRLSVVPLTLPPLRDRRDDVLPLAETFLAREPAPSPARRRTCCAGTTGPATCASCARWWSGRRSSPATRWWPRPRFRRRWRSSRPRSGWAARGGHR
jgi:transcriptional regulator with GAF, ATPase, and Fis domain